MLKAKILLPAILTALFCLGMVPASKADVEMYLYPYRVYTYPGGQVYFNVIVANSDTVSHDLRLKPNLLCWYGDTVGFPDRFFSLDPGESITQGVVRTVPIDAILGEYILVLRLYDLDIRRLIAIEHSHIYVEWGRP